MSKEDKSHLLTNPLRHETKKFVCAPRHEKDRPSHLQLMDPDDIPEIITREEWGALPFTSSEPSGIPYIYVRVQCTGKEICVTKEECIKYVQDMQKDHMERLKEPDILFNFLISPEGYIFETRGWFRDAYREGKHDPILKGRFFSIGYIGDYIQSPVPMKVHAAAWELVKYGWAKEYFPNDPIPLVQSVGNIDFTHYY